jgi:hypothetical protein
MDANEPVVIHTTSNPAEAEILKNMLEADGIRCELEGENQGSFVGVLNIRLLVRAWDEDRARELIATHGHQHGGHSGKQRGEQGGAGNQGFRPST